jgi:Kef-type K+ transport system membrane component KefB
MALQLLVFAILILTALAIKTLIHRFKQSPIIGYILVGLALKFLDDQFNLLQKGGLANLSFFAELGIAVLLFRVGLKSNLEGLKEQFKRATEIALSAVVVSGAFGFCASYYILNFELLPSLLVATAFTATSIAVSVSSWQESGKLKTKSGQLLLDLAALDDVLAILIMSVVTSVGHLVHLQGAEHMGSYIAVQCGLYILKLFGFILLCYLFSHFAEKRLVNCLKRYEALPDPIISVVCVALIIAGIAGLFGLSFALGGFFAGLAFCRDPKALKMEPAVLLFEDFFAPFFFIWIGYRLSHGDIMTGWPILVVLTLAAILGKLIGTYTPSRLIGIGRTAGAALAISMVPRAEVALIVTSEAHKLGTWAMPPELYTHIVVAALITCLAPLFLPGLLGRVGLKEKETSPGTPQ